LVSIFRPQKVLAAEVERAIAEAKFPRGVTE
jgi:hypothetical protein